MTIEQIITKLLNIHTRLIQREDRLAIMEAVSYINNTWNVDYTHTYERAIEHFGKKNQMVVAMEEMSELVKELSKDYRELGDKKHIAEEIADCEIMLGQLKIIYNCKDKVEDYKYEKCDRLEKRINEDKTMLRMYQETIKY